MTPEIREAEESYFLERVQTAERFWQMGAAGTIEYGYEVATVLSLAKTLQQYALAKKLVMEGPSKSIFALIKSSL